MECESGRVSEHASQRGSKRALEQASEHASERASEWTLERTSEPTSERTSEPASELASKLASECGAGCAAKPASEPASEPAAECTAEPELEQETKRGSEAWMDSDEMRQLNPLGGYFKIKNHLQSVHQISEMNLGKYNVLCKKISERMLYDHLASDIRYIHRLYIRLHVFFF